MTRLLPAAAVALVALSAPAMADPFAGRWEVTIVTTRGACDQAYLVPLEVSGGRIVYRGSAGLSGGGTVARNGTIRTNFFRSGDTIQANGRLTANAGNGTWVAPQRDCAGTWTARRG
jgi:hypothetical protein